MTTKKQVRVPKTRMSFEHEPNPVPKGWRALRVGEIRRKGDKFSIFSGFDACWQIGQKITEKDIQSAGPYIRRLPARRGKGRK